METAYLIIPIENLNEESEKSEEISELAKSAGAEVRGSSVIKIVKITPATYIGKGKAEEINEKVKELDCSIVIFDGDLTPSQTLNLSAALSGVKVIDRTTLILDIFALSAKSAEGKVQVELAQLKYIYPRLKGKGSALSRLGGGIGTRGPGESQLETDRRHIRRRINYLEERLKDLESRRNIQSLRRNKNGIFKVALVGYTNTGKSTLLNSLTGSEVLAENKLFATLDSTVKKLNIGDFTVLISDTVGFIKNIPTTLIEAFKSTLETAVDADLILIVCDALTDWQTQLGTTKAMLDELKAQAPYVIVMNKCENIKDFAAFPNDCIFISAKEKKGLDGLLLKIRSFFENNYIHEKFYISYDKLNLFYKLKNYCENYDIGYTDDGVVINAVINKKNAGKFENLKQR